MRFIKTLSSLYLYACCDINININIFFYIHIHIDSLLLLLFECPSRQLAATLWLWPDWLAGWLVGWRRLMSYKSHSINHAQGINYIFIHFYWTLTDARQWEYEKTKRQRERELCWNEITWNFKALALNCFNLKCLSLPTTATNSHNNWSTRIQ